MYLVALGMVVAVMFGVGLAFVVMVRSERRRHADELQMARKERAEVVARVVAGSLRSWNPVGRGTPTVRP